MTTADFQPGGYRFVPGVFQYPPGSRHCPDTRCGGCNSSAAAGRRLRAGRGSDRGGGTAPHRLLRLRVAVARPVFRDGFRRFNEGYVDTLSRWGIFDGATNPVARSNVCPEIGGPSEPSFHAFTFTVAGDAARPSFVVAGSGECPEGLGDYRDNIVRLGDLSQEAILEKARFVLGEMERRLTALGAGWSDVTATQVYTVHDIHPFLAGEIVARGAAPAGVTWHFDRPPVVDLEYEMDCRGVHEELVV